MGINVHLIYDQLIAMVRGFRDDGEDSVQLHNRLRDKVRDLHKDWEGDAANNFFKVMEGELLPAVSRLARAEFALQDALHRIIRLIQDMDQEIAGFFKGELGGDLRPEYRG